MSPDRRGVGCDGDILEKCIAKKTKKRKVAKKRVFKEKVAKEKVAKKKLAATGNKTSPSVACVRNLGNSPRVPGAYMGADHVGKSLPTRRDERRSRPTHQRIMSLLSMAVVPEERNAFRRRFRSARSRDGDWGSCEEFLCRTPIAVIAKAFGCEPLRLRSAADMFPESGLQSEFLNEFYVMDVVLNRAPSPAVLTGDGKGLGSGGGRSSAGGDIDAVRPVLLCKPEDVGPEMDYLYRAAILFLPQCGVFYCHRDRHIGDAGVPGTLRAYDMSWLRLQRREGATQYNFPSYTFGSDSFVRRFYSDLYLGDNFHRSVSAWRISTGHTLSSQQNRVVYRAIQCRDSELPPLPPDFIAGVDLRTVPPDYRAHEFLNKLKTSNSAKFDCRHYVDGSHHYNLPESCWIIDPDDTHFIDVHVVVDGTPNRESVVMIRNVTKIGARDDCLGLLKRLTSRCREIRVSGAKGTARAKSSDVGSMFALGTRIEKKESGAGLAVHTKIPYAANGCVAEGVLRSLVVDLATLGSRCFPQVYSVIRDTEENSGLSPVSPMDGVALPTGGGGDDDNSGGGSDCDDGDDVVNGGDCDGVRKILRKRMEKLELRRRVGYTIDMSINLGNSSHYDVNDASQGYSVWTEEMLGLGQNWYFVVPNVHGLRPDGKTRFRGMAVKLGHGVAISWDGRVIRHCTSVSCPDGMECGYVAGKRESPFQNHLYGTFTSAKEKIVGAGRAGCAERYCLGGPSPVNNVMTKACSKKKRQNKKRRRPRGGRPEVDTTGGVDCPAVELASDEPALKLPAVAHPPVYLEGTGNKQRFRTDDWSGRKPDVGRDWLSHASWQKEDLDVGGRYKIPKKLKK